MIEIETFVRSPDGQFVEVGDCHTPPPDLDYIEGAIRLSIDGIEMIGLEQWDYVDQLWCYIADMVTQLEATGHSETYFPDQPIQLSFHSSGSLILVTARMGKNTKRASIPPGDLLTSVKTAGLAFFEKMAELAPGNSYTEAQQQLSS